eukprot:4751238-Amphidinium_carterae.1
MNGGSCCCMRCHSLPASKPSLFLMRNKVWSRPTKFVRRRSHSERVRCPIVKECSTGLARCGCGSRCSGNPATLSSAIFQNSVQAVSDASTSSTAKSGATVPCKA